MFHIKSWSIDNEEGAISNNQIFFSGEIENWIERKFLHLPMPFVWQFLIHCVDALCSWHADETIIIVGNISITLDRLRLRVFQMFRAIFHLWICSCDSLAAHRQNQKNKWVAGVLCRVPQNRTVAIYSTLNAWIVFPVILLYIWNVRVQSLLWKWQKCTI